MKNLLWALLAASIVTVVADVGVDAFVQLMFIYVIINAILALSLNLINGITGQFSLGHAGFMAVGAYVSAYLSSVTSVFSPFGQLVFFPLLALIGGLAAAVAGFCVGLPSLRLKGDYLAIVTLGFGEIIRVLLLNTPAVGGARGFYGIPGPVDLDLGFIVISKFYVNCWYSLFWFTICFFSLWRLKNSAFGQKFFSVRDDEIAAEAMGVDTTKTKVLAFVISSFFAGVAGSLFAHYANYINPASFGFQRSVDVIIMVVLGGMGSLSGSVISAVFVTLLPELLRPLQEITGVDLRMVIYASCLVLLMILRPQGLFGSKEWVHVLRSWRLRFYGRKSA